MIKSTDLGFSRILMVLLLLSVSHSAIHLIAIDIAAYLKVSVACEMDWSVWQMGIYPIKMGYHSVEPYVFMHTHKTFIIRSFLFLVRLC